MGFSCKSVIGLALLVWIVCSCGSGKGRSPIDFDTVSVAKNVVLAETAGSPGCKIDFVVHYAKADAGKKSDYINAVIVEKLFGLHGLSVSQAVDSFANAYVGDYMANVTPAYKHGEGGDASALWYDYRYSIATDVYAGLDGVVVYVASMEYSEGGAPAVNQKIALNFNASTGRLMTLADVFVPGYERRLGEVLTSALMKNAGAADIDELRRQGYLCSMDIYAPDNFIVGENAITFIYNVYEIAPYSKGRTELTISYSEVNELL